MRLPLHRSLAISLALSAMVLRALLPDGWMPASAAGAAPFVICGIDGAHDGKAPAQPGRDIRHAPCAFSAAAPLAPAGGATLAPAALPRAERIARVFTGERRASAAAYRANAPRAPPTVS
ncbi:MAG TPA: hypothetical protein VNU97_00925 [Rhizomicrobium sp.]|jgi:hypothetical protein|nr:hypothetical protein [Rhizomicrobium sp.]